MNTKDAKEFRIVIAALAAEYGASRKDVITAATGIAATGRRPIDDEVALTQAARMRLNGSARSDWAAADAVAAQRPGHSKDATAQRLHRAMRKPSHFYKWFPDAARIISEREGIELGHFREGPFERARRALQRVLAETDRV